MMNMYDKVKAIREQIAQWGYEQINVIPAHEDSMIYIWDKILNDHPELPEMFSLKRNTSDNFFNNGRLQQLGQVKLAFYM